MLKRTYHIGILNYTLFEDNPSFYAEYMLMDTKTHKIYTDKLNIRILDLTKADQAAVCTVDGNIGELIKWAKVFRATTMKELEQLADKDEVVSDMVVHLKELSEDEKIRQQCQAREDYERRLIGAYRRGSEEGIEKGREEGQKGIIELCKESSYTKKQTVEKLMKLCGISESEAVIRVEKYW